MDRIALHGIRILECELCLDDGRDSVFGALVILDLVGLVDQRMLEVWGQHGDQSGCPHLLTEQLVEISSQCQDLGLPPVDKDRDLLESLRFDWVDGCHRELHAPHWRRGAVPLGELSPRLESTESARVQHLAGFALD